MKEGNHILNEIRDKVDRMALDLERAKIAEYIEFMQDTRRLLLVNFIVGLVRGLGIAVGFTILGAIVVYFLRRLVMLNLPLIGDFIAEIVKIVSQSL